MNYFINKTLFLILFSLLLFESKLFTATSVEVNLPREFTCDGFKLYNSLPEVELADKKLQESGSLEQFLTEAQELAQRYNLEDSMGVLLIHRHADINGNQIMVQKREIFEGQDALVTRRYSKVHENEATPTSWIFDGEQYRVFEYSYDAYVPKIFERVRKSSDFLDAFASLLKKYDYQSLIALAITDREWYQNYTASHSFLERSYYEPTFASVLVNIDGLENLKAIGTSWTFKNVPFICKCLSRCATDVHGKHIEVHWRAER
jgi:hypothetical protein